jgi:hypothetical protein
MAPGSEDTGLQHTPAPKALACAALRFSWPRLENCVVVDDPRRPARVDPAMGSPCSPFRHASDS